MDETTFEAGTTSEVETLDNFYEETADAASMFDAKKLGIGGAIVAIGGTLVYKKFGPAIKAKFSDIRKKGLEKQKTKLAERQLKVDAKLKAYETPKEEAEKTEE